MSGGEPRRGFRFRARQRRIETGCTLEIEQTPEHFHAHAVLDGALEIRPGDRVVLHGAPVRLAFGERRTERRAATIWRAGLATRLWTRLRSRFELSALYEVSFTPGRTP